MVEPVATPTRAWAGKRAWMGVTDCSKGLCPSVVHAVWRFWSLCELCMYVRRGPVFLFFFSAAGKDSSQHSRRKGAFLSKTIRCRCCFVRPSIVRMIPYPLFSSVFARKSRSFRGGRIIFSLTYTDRMARRVYPPLSPCIKYYRPRAILHLTSYITDGLLN